MRAQLLEKEFDMVHIRLKFRFFMYFVLCYIDFRLKILIIILIFENSYDKQQSTHAQFS